MILELLKLAGLIDCGQCFIYSLRDQNGEGDNIFVNTYDKPRDGLKKEKELGLNTSRIS